MVLFHVCPLTAQHLTCSQLSGYHSPRSGRSSGQPILPSDSLLWQDAELEPQLQPRIAPPRQENG